jgi:hypothetical protein
VINILKVVGNSMLPTIKPKAFVMVRATWLKKLEVADIVLVKHACFGLIIKRLIHLDYSCGHTIAGDNRHSVSADTLGKVYSNDILGVVFLHTSN